MSAENFDDVVWDTSSFCNFGDCVEIGRHPDGRILVRDTKSRGAGPLVFQPGEWGRMVAGIKAGEFDPS